MFSLVSTTPNRPLVLLRSIIHRLSSLVSRISFTESAVSVRSS